MFCSECGAKNEKDALFCSECGFKFEEEKPKKEVKKETKKVVESKEEPKVEKEVSNTEKKKSSAKLIFLIILATVIAGGYKILSDMTSPKEVAKGYIDAVVNNDADRIYDYIEIKGDKTFASKKMFKKIYGDNNKTDVENYSVTKTEYGKGNLTATVYFNYTVKGSEEEKTGSVKLTKLKEKTYFIFDTWKINDFKDNSSLVAKDYKISAMKGTKIVFGDVEVTDKYLDKKASTDTLDVYVLPQVFTIKTKIKATLPNGLDVEKEVTPSGYYDSYTVSFNEEDLTEKQKDKIASTSKKILVNLYESAIDGDDFDSIKSTYKHDGVDMSKLEKSYNTFVKDLSGDYYKLTKFDINDISVYSIYLNTEGNLEVQYKVTYDYTVEYKSGDEVKTKDRTNISTWMTLMLGSDKDGYYLTNIKSLNTYFY